MNFSWVAELWNQSPKGLKKVLAGVLLVFAIVFGIVIGVHVWTAGWIQDKLGIVATKDDLEEQTTTIAAQQALVASEVDAALARYDESVKGYLQQERKLAVDTTLKPLLKLVFELRDDIRETKASTERTRTRVESMPQPQRYEDLQRIIQEQPPSRTDQLLERVLDRLDEQDQRIDTLLRHKSRNTKVRM